MTQGETGDSDQCRQCSAALVAEEGQRPWCERCEWNLDAFEPVAGSWLVRSVSRADRRAGFRADRWLAKLSVADDAIGRPRIGYLFLCAVSAVLLLLPLGLLVGGLWLVVTTFFLPAILLGLLFIAIAYGLRPRLFSLRALLRGRYRVDPQRAPALHALINEVAERTGAPRPDVVVLDESWNAGAAVVGVRRTRVLILGIPMLVALRRPELVALIGHELGHLHHADSLRNLLTQPARTTFGLLSQAVRPPRGDVHERDLEGIATLAYTLWQLVGGALSWLFFMVHLGLNLVDSHDGRRAELRADLLAARAAGTTAALELVDALALTPILAPLVAPTGNVGGALRQWRTDIERTRERNQERVSRLRQLSIRTSASLFGSHPAPGRRHQVLAARPHVQAAVVLTESRAELLDEEIKPYVEAMRKRLADLYEL
nr:M48 family metallopeptidase [Micromonospora sp. DSM 115978]